jgi:hypothetical protein
MIDCWMILLGGNTATLTGHLGAIRKEWGFLPSEYRKVNIEGTKKILDASKKNQIQHFIIRNRLTELLSANGTFLGFFQPTLDATATKRVSTSHQRFGIIFSQVEFGLA